MDIERDKFLTEQMSECWHEINENELYHLYNDFSTPEGFFKLFNWTKEQPWFEDLLYRYWSCPEPRRVFPYHFIDPDKFADSLYKFLTGVFPSYYLKWKEEGRYCQIF
jgi:hypothetical protein